jgi:glycosyltransferase involved in cell wall biosynthesis
MTNLENPLKELSKKEIAQTWEIVVVVRWLDADKASGVVNWLASIATHFSAQAKSVTILSQKNILSRNRTEKIKNMQVIRLKPSINLPRILATKIPPIFAQWNIPINDWIFKKAEDPNSKIIVIAPMAGLEAVLLRNLPENVSWGALVVTNYSLDKENEWKATKRGKRIAEIERWTLENSQILKLVDSDAIRKDIENELAIQLREIEIKKVVIGFTFPELMGEKEKFILFVGRIDKRKNLIQLLKVWEEIMKDVEIDPEWRLIVLGNRGNDDTAWQKIVDLQSSCGGRFQHFSNQNDESRNRFYARASVVVVPSLYESFGMVAAEAVAQRCIVIAKNIGGLPEVLGSEGLFFTSDSELYQSIKKVINSIQNREKLVDQAQKRIKKEYSNERMIESFIDAFSK